MQPLFLLCLIAFLSGCVNSNNLSFEPKKPNEFKVAYNCKIIFDDMRFYGQFINKNSTKTIYYVDHKKIIESRFELTKTTMNLQNFSLKDYIQILQEDTKVEFLKIHGGIAYVRFVKKETTFYQLITASSNKLNIVNIEPLMFDVLYTQCVL